jgi:hypothetical protein
MQISLIFKPLVDEIRKYEKVQISLKDIDTSLQRYPGQNPAVGDRFTFVVPYCKKELTWTVICNAQSPSTPPDILLSEGEEVVRVNSSKNNTLIVLSH